MRFPFSNNVSRKEDQTGCGRKRNELREKINRRMIYESVCMCGVLMVPKKRKRNMRAATHIERKPDPAATQNSVIVEKHDGKSLLWWRKLFFREHERRVEREKHATV
jgi:hypothetical protein